MPMTAREMISHLQKHGFVIVSQNGSHVKMRNSSSGKQTIIPKHGELKKGLEHAILKQAGLK